MRDGRWTTVRDVYLWTAYVLGAIVLAVVLVALYRRCVDWYDKHSYLPPADMHVSKAGWVLPDLEDSPTPVETLDVPAAEPEVWKRTALHRDWVSLAEFARPEPTAAALIWAEMVGVRHVKGLVTA